MSAKKRDWESFWIISLLIVLPLGLVLFFVGMEILKMAALVKWVLS